MVKYQETKLDLILTITTRTNIFRVNTLRSIKVNTLKQNFSGRDIKATGLLEAAQLIRSLNN